MVSETACHWPAQVRGKWIQLLLHGAELCSTIREFLLPWAPACAFRCITSIKSVNHC